MKRKMGTCSMSALFMIFHFEDFIAGSHKLWGSPPDTNSANIGWHAPSDAEVDFAVEIVNEYGPLCVKMFKELMAASSATGHSKEMSNDFCKWLTILRSVIAGINTLTGDSCSDVMESAYSSQESLEREGEANPVKLQSIEIGLPLMNPEDPRYKI